MSRTMARKYNFADFTFRNYRRLLDIAGRNHKFRTYTDFKKEENFVLWRHDIDFSMHSTRSMARIEAEKGIRATYFLLPHSEFYNLLEKEIFDIVKEIIGLGHEIGLHFDSHFYSITSENEIGRHLKKEKDFLEGLISKKIEVFSFHNTEPFTMNCKKWKYAGLVNTYAEYFQDNVKYCSESNGYWRHKRLEDILTDPGWRRLQVLTHPGWWQAKPMPPFKRVLRCIDGRAKKTLKTYLTCLAESGRKDIR
jgi:hypothetical protein